MQMINKHMKGLLIMATLTTRNDLKGLRKIYNQVEAHVRGLNVLGVLW